MEDIAAHGVAAEADVETAALAGELRLALSTAFSARRERRIFIVVSLFAI